LDAFPLTKGHTQLQYIMEKKQDKKFLMFTFIWYQEVKMILAVQYTVYLIQR
jgi:hypothetical protein